MLGSPLPAKVSDRDEGVGLRTSEQPRTQMAAVGDILGTAALGSVHTCAGASRTKRTGLAIVEEEIASQDPHDPAARWKSMRWKEGTRSGVGSKRRRDTSHHPFGSLGRKKSKVGTWTWMLAHSKEEHEGAKRRMLDVDSRRMSERTTQRLMPSQRLSRRS